MIRLRRFGIRKFDDQSLMIWIWLQQIKTTNFDSLLKNWQFISSDLMIALPFNSRDNKKKIIQSINKYLIGIALIIWVIWFWRKSTRRSPRFWRSGFQILNFWKQSSSKCLIANLFHWKAFGDQITQLTNLVNGSEWTCRFWKRLDLVRDLEIILRLEVQAKDNIWVRFQYAEVYPICKLWKNL